MESSEEQMRVEEADERNFFFTPSPQKDAKNRLGFEFTPSPYVDKTQKNETPKADEAEVEADETPFDVLCNYLDNLGNESSRQLKDLVEEFQGLFLYADVKEGHQEAFESILTNLHEYFNEKDSDKLGALINLARQMGKWINDRSEDDGCHPADVAAPIAKILLREFSKKYPGTKTEDIMILINNTMIDDAADKDQLDRVNKAVFLFAEKQIVQGDTSPKAFREVFDHLLRQYTSNKEYWQPLMDRYVGLLPEGDLMNQCLKQITVEAKEVDDFAEESEEEEKKSEEEEEKIALLGGEQEEENELQNKYDAIYNDLEHVPLFKKALVAMRKAYNADDSAKEADLISNIETLQSVKREAVDNNNPNFGDDLLQKFNSMKNWYNTRDCNNIDPKVRANYKVAGIVLGAVGVAVAVLGIAFIIAVSVVSNPGAIFGAAMVANKIAAATTAIAFGVAAAIGGGALYNHGMLEKDTRCINAIQKQYPQLVPQIDDFDF